MANCQVVKNFNDGKNYFISITPTNKRITIPTIPPSMPEYKNLLPPIAFNHLIFEAAIWIHTKPKLFSKPILVIHVDDGYGAPNDDLGKLIFSLSNNRDKFLKPHISEEDFTTLILNLVSNETFINLYEEITVYDKYGYIAVRHDIWSIWFWQRIKHIFLLKQLSK